MQNYNLKSRLIRAGNAFPPNLLLSNYGETMQTVASVISWQKWHLVWPFSSDTTCPTILNQENCCHWIFFSRQPVVLQLREGYLSKSHQYHRHKQPCPNQSHSDACFKLQQIILTVSTWLNQTNKVACECILKAKPEFDDSWQSHWILSFGISHYW